MMESETMTKKNHVKQVVNSNIINLILLSVVIAFIIAYTFSTDFFPKKSVELTEHNKKYSEIISKRDLALQNAIKGLEVEQLIQKIKASSNLELKNFSKKYKEIKKRDSFLGYTSFKNFLLGTGKSLLSFTISLFFLFIVVKHIRGKFIKRYYLVTSFVFVAVSGYWLAWSLLYFSLDPKRGFDFPKSWYYICIYILPSLIFVASYYLFKYNNTIEGKLKNGIKLLINYISIDLFDKRINEEEKNKVLIENLEKYNELKNIIE